jgi:two-component system response regulator AtoC
MNGIEVLCQAKVSSPATIILMMSAYHMVDRAVEAMKLGAYDYLIKPFHVADMVDTLQSAAEMLALRVRVHDTVQSAKGLYDFGRVVTMSPVMCEILQMARRAAESERTTILIQGESGTGKEVLAKAIHYNSPRAQMPLISLNCAALPDTLLESELFGYEPGAFTDARRRKEGLIEKAVGGTLFLDEIGNTSPSLQAKLLRVLEEGYVHAPGWNQSHPGQCANHCRHQHAVERVGDQRGVPRRPLLPAQRSAFIHPTSA